MNEGTANRQEAKSAEQLFLHVLVTDYEYSPRISQGILKEAQTLLMDEPGRIEPGQQRVVLVAKQAGHGCWKRRWIKEL
jgi:hypothetical protein